MRRVLTWLFAVVLKLFPRGFRNTYALEMSDVFAERIGNASGIRLVVTGAREIGDLAIAAVTSRMQTITTIDASRAVILALLMLVSGHALRTSSASPPASTGRIEFSAHDPAGDFTLTILDGRAVGATINSVRLPAERIAQDGDSIRVLASTGIVALALSFDPATGRIEWNPRSSGCGESTVDCESAR